MPMYSAISDLADRSPHAANAASMKLQAVLNELRAMAEPTGTVPKHADTANGGPRVHMFSPTRQPVPRHNGKRLKIHNYS
jgi:hypothetical protein